MKTFYTMRSQIRVVINRFVFVLFVEFPSVNNDRAPQKRNTYMQMTEQMKTENTEQG